MKVTLVLPLLVSGVSMAQSPGTFTRSGDMHQPRSGHTATLLNDGRVLIAGGWQTMVVGNVAQTPEFVGAEVYDPTTGAFTSVSNMITPRVGHLATLLADGRVLIGGGVSGSSQLQSAELFDPTSGTFTRTGTMPAISCRSAVRLADGRVLFTGCFPQSLQIYDPSTGTFASLNDQPDQNGNSVLLPDGTVLILGFGDAQIYNATTGSLKITGPMTDAQYAPNETVLLNGKVLIAGNLGPPNDGDSPICPAPCNSSELYDPVTGSFTRTAQPSAPRIGNSTALLSDGTVLFAGGVSLSGSYLKPELFDPTTNAYQPLPDLIIPRVGSSTTLLNDGTVLITGGTNSSTGNLVFPPTSERYTPATRIAPPVLLTLSGSANGAGAILHGLTLLPVTPDNPATTGEAIAIYATGLADRAAIPPFVTIGGRGGQVLWFGGAPGYPGLYQINAVVPSGIASGPAAPVRLLYIDRPSNLVTVGVR